MTPLQPERGTKRVCQSCEARFYDLAREHPVCPKCGAEYIEAVRPAPAPSRPRRWGAFGNARTEAARDAEADPTGRPETDDREPAAALLEDLEDEVESESEEEPED